MAELFYLSSTFREKKRVIEVFATEDFMKKVPTATCALRDR